MSGFQQLIVGEHYRLEAELGRGGMATVWKARDLRHERSVAIKVLHPELAGAIGVDRFLREIRLTAQLQHPNIVPILDSGVLPASDGTSLPWYAMSYLSGQSLRERLGRERQPPVEEALVIAETVAEALGAAHRAGIVHRDIKPENIFLSDGRVYVVDFGIAKALLAEGDKLTSTGLAIGTPAYMSPEQGFGGEVDARTDQYSLATVLYEMLTGDPPFSGNTVQAIMARRLAEPARPLVTVRSTVPPAVERAVLRALERTPADRYPDIGGFARALRAGGGARPGRKWSVAIVAAAMLLAVGVAVWRLRASAAARRSRAESPEVNNLYTQAVRAYDRRTPAGVVEAIALFGSVVARDSSYPLGWTGLAKAYVRAYQRVFPVPGVSRDSMLARAVSAVDRGLALDSSLVDGWVTRASLTQVVDPTNNDVPIRYLRRALALDSSSAVAWRLLGVFTEEQGDVARGLDYLRRSVRADPGYAEGLAFLALGHYWRAAFDSAAFWADSAVAIEPNYLLGRRTVADVAVEQGQWDRARAAYDASRRLSTGMELINSLAGAALVEARAGRQREAREILRRVDSALAAPQPLGLHTSVYVAGVLAALGEPAKAVAWLTRYQPGADLHFQLHLRCDPPIVPIRAWPRFRALLLRPAPAGAAGC